MGAHVEPFLAEDAVRAAELLLRSAADPGPTGDCLSLGDALCIAVAERLRRWRRPAAEPADRPTLPGLVVSEPAGDGAGQLFDAVVEAGQQVAGSASGAQARSGLRTQAQLNHPLPLSSDRWRAGGGDDHTGPDGLAGPGQTFRVSWTLLVTGHNLIIGASLASHAGTGVRMPKPWEEPSPWVADDPAAPTVVGGTQAQAPDITAFAGEDVFVPSERFSPGAEAAAPELRRQGDGRVALLVYSSLELLVSGCGQAQPWIRIRLASPEALDALARLAGADIVLRDVDIPKDLRRMSRSGRGTKRRGEDEGR